MGNQKSKAPRVLTAFSGSPASIVCAALLKNQGHEVVGLNIKIDSDHNQHAFGQCGFACLKPKRKEAAHESAKRLGIELLEVDCSDQFHEKVADRAVHEMARCRTADSCFVDFEEIIFGSLFAHLEKAGAPLAAAGIYAQIQIDSSTERPILQRAVELQRDQSFLLYRVPEANLKKLLLPLGNLTSQMVEKLARELGGSISESITSFQCLEDNNAKRVEYLQSRIPKTLRAPGMVRDINGVVIGKHDGLFRYQPGQSEGLHLHIKEADHYVVLGFDLRNNVLISGEEENLYKKSVIGTNTRWLKRFDGLHVIPCEAQISATRKTIPCGVTCFEGDRILVDFSAKVRGLTPGRNLIFYDGNQVIGGCVIEDEFHK